MVGLARSPQSKMIARQCESTSTNARMCEKKKNQTKKVIQKNNPYRLWLMASGARRLRATPRLPRALSCSEMHNTQIFFNSQLTFNTHINFSTQHLHNRKRSVAARPYMTNASTHTSTKYLTRSRGVRFDNAMDDMRFVTRETYLRLMCWKQGFSCLFPEL